jgi:hypothetical protein
MHRDPPLVLIAGVSLHERRIVQATLEKTGFTAVVVDVAEDAARELSANGASGVLVIDSGLLQAAHDSQWRELRTRNPGLGAVVRCLVPRANASRRTNGSTLLVHPDDDEGLRQAVGLLAAGPRPNGSPPASPPRPHRSAAALRQRGADATDEARGVGVNRTLGLV